MITLTSAQEAAFNAAAEAALELGLADPDSYSSNVMLFFYRDGVSAGVRHPTKKNESIYSPKAPTAAEAMADALRRLEEAKNAPMQLKTAREAIDAVKEILPTIAEGGELLLGELEERIDALPVA